MESRKQFFKVPVIFRGAIFSEHLIAGISGWMRKRFSGVSFVYQF
jgi:hypothetical protein